MRFLLGVLLGAAAVVLVAEGVSGEQWRERAGAAADRALALLEDLGRPTEPAQVSDTGPAPVAQPTQATSSVPRAGEPVHDEVATSGPTAHEPDVVAPAVSEPAGEPIPLPPDPDIAAAPAGAEPRQPAGAAADSHAVWVPFRSRISARGFAERLSDSLGHPFRVERQGPARYQVVFSYADEPERRDLLARASAATGLPL